MKIAGIGGHRSVGVVNLEVDGHGFIVEVLHRHPRPFAERHRPIGIERAARVHADRKRGQRRILSPSHRKERTHRNFDRRSRFIVPVHPENGPLPVSCRRHPDVLNRTMVFDVGESDRLVRADDQKRIFLPSLPQVARGLGGRTMRLHAAFALFPGQVFGTNGKSLGVRKPKNIPDAIVEPIIGRALRNGGRRANDCGTDDERHPDIHTNLLPAIMLSPIYYVSSVMKE